MSSKTSHRVYYKLGCFQRADSRGGRRSSSWGEEVHEHVRGGIPSTVAGDCQGLAPCSRPAQGSWSEEERAGAESVLSSLKPAGDAGFVKILEKLCLSAVPGKALESSSLWDRS